MISWICVILAIFLEIIATSCLKLSEGFSKILPSILTFVFYGLSFAILGFSLKKLEVSIVYAVWSGMGTVLITVIGIFWLNESVSPLKIGAIILILMGVIILKLNSEPTIAQEQGILSAGSAVNINLVEITEPAKIEDLVAR